MPDRIISPPMVGVPALAMMCDFGPSARIGWPLPWSSRSRSMMVWPNRNTKQQRGDDRAAGAEGDVAKHIEDGELVRQIDQPIEHRINLVRTRLRVRLRSCLRSILARIGPLQRLDDGRHARAERALDHDGVAGADRGQHLRFERGRVLCIAAAAARGKSLPQRVHQRPAAEHQIDRIGQHRIDAARDARRGLSAQAPACRRARRCAGRAGRPAPGRAPPAPPPSKPDWRCSCRR